jgi:hypothetical protein
MLRTWPQNPLWKAVVDMETGRTITWYFHREFRQTTRTKLEGFGRRQCPPKSKVVEEAGKESLVQSTEVVCKDFLVLFILPIS